MKKVFALLMLFMVLAMMVVFPAVAEEVAAPMIGIDLTPILQALVGFLAALITAKVIPWIKSKTTAQQQATLGTVVDVLVYAAEQLYRSNQIQDRMDYVTEQLVARGYSVDVAAIEAAVKKMNWELG